MKYVSVRVNAIVQVYVNKPSRNVIEPLLFGVFLSAFDPSWEVLV